MFSSISIWIFTGCPRLRVPPRIPEVQQLHNEHRQLTQREILRNSNSKVSNFVREIHCWKGPNIFSTSAGGSIRPSSSNGNPAAKKNHKSESKGKGNQSQSVRKFTIYSKSFFRNGHNSCLEEKGEEKKYVPQKKKRNLGSLAAKREALNCVTVILNTFRLYIV